MKLISAAAFHQIGRPCHYCGRPMGGIKGPPDLRATRDHQVPRSKEGGNGPNIVWCCWLCNNMKGALDVETFLKQAARIAAHNQKETIP